MGFGNFGSFGETDMMLRNVNTGGAFEMTRLALGITEALPLQPRCRSPA
jgi:hypothetical protein